MELEPILMCVVSLLFAGNIFFIKKLVNKVETNNDSTRRMENTLSNFDTQLKDLKQDIKELRKIEIDVAILKHESNKIRSEE